MASADDPVGNGFVANLARPGGNITGLSQLAPELSGKRLDLLKEIIPRLSRLAVFGTSTNPGDAQMLKEIEPVIRVLRLRFQHIDALAAKDIEPAFRAAAKARADAVLMNVSGVVAAGRRKEIVQLAVKNRLPVMYTRAEYVEEGGLVSYGVSIDALDRRAATYVDKILKGRNPTDLPVEQPMKFEFIVSLIAANQIGFTVPPNVLVRATKVIR